jgi:mannosyltransferase OCH1-like enzyme
MIIRTIIFLIVIFLVIIFLVYAIYLNCFFYHEEGIFLTKPNNILIKNIDTIAKKYKATLTANYQQLIPMHIVQTNNKSKVLGRIKQVPDYLHAMNAEYELRYFNDEDSRQFLLENYDKNVVDCYDSLYPGAYKADLFRTAYLLKNGGIYVDIGIVPIVAFRHILKSDTTFLGVKDYKIAGKNFGAYLYNGLIACTANHPIIKYCFNKIIENVSKKSYCNNALDVTGPGVLGEAFDRVTNIKLKTSGEYNDIIILQHNIDFNLFGNRNCYLLYKNNLLFYTKYIGYYEDQKINNKIGYQKLYSAKQIYGEKGKYLLTNNNIEDKQIITQNVEFFPEIYIPSSYKLSNNNCYNKILYYKNIKNDKEKANLYYLENMNSDIQFLESVDNKDYNIDLSYFFLYPLSTYPNYILNDKEEIILKTRDAKYSIILSKNNNIFSNKLIKL